MSNPSLMDYFLVPVKLHAGLNDEKLNELRHSLANYAAEQFSEAAADLRKSDNKANLEIINAISLLLEFASSLVSGANVLFSQGNTYAAAALVRQLVEIEYLAYAFESDQREARKWISCDSTERMKFFTPSKLRQAAQGKFRSKDYGYHCEYGGHPVPQADILLRASDGPAQLLLTDMLGHAGRIWDHLVGWAQADSSVAILSRSENMLKRFIEWKRADVLTTLPPPP